MFLCIKSYITLGLPVLKHDQVEILDSAINLGAPRQMLFEVFFLFPREPVTFVSHSSIVGAINENSVVTEKSQTSVLPYFPLIARSIRQALG